jgi:hypothetical protein
MRISESAVGRETSLTRHVSNEGSRSTDVTAVSGTVRPASASHGDDEPARAVGLGTAVTTPTTKPIRRACTIRIILSPEPQNLPVVPGGLADEAGLVALCGRRLPHEIRIPRLAHPWRLRELRGRDRPERASGVALHHAVDASGCRCSEHRAVERSSARLRRVILRHQRPRGETPAGTVSSVLVCDPSRSSAAGYCRRTVPRGPATSRMRRSPVASGNGVRRAAGTPATRTGSASGSPRRRRPRRPARSARVPCAAGRRPG